MAALFRLRWLLLLPLLLGLTGCLFRSRKVERTLTTAELREATKEELVAAVNREAARIQTLKATVEMQASVGGPKLGKITEYTEVQGYILVRKPEMIRMIGLFPVVRNRAFDMVSDGDTFKLSIPSKNKFIVGSNEIVKPSEKPLENLRPQHIFDALLLQPIDPTNEIAVLQTGYDVVYDPEHKKQLQQPNYGLLVIRKGAEGWLLSRKIVFDRIHLQIEQQIVYDKFGNVATDATYEDYRDYGGIIFPSLIRVRRPQEEYSILLKIEKLEVNQPIQDQQFALEKPAGAELVMLDKSKSEFPAGGPPHR